MNQLFERTELLLIWHLPGASTSFPTRITLIDAFTVCGWPIYNLSLQNKMSPGPTKQTQLTGHGDTTETHSDLSR
jgi:hypothetical protein